MLRSPFWVALKGLLAGEKKLIILILSLSPVLFYIGSFFVFYFVMPRAWEFFLSYENNSINIPLVLETPIDIRKTNANVSIREMPFSLKENPCFVLPVVRWSASDDLSTPPYRPHIDF